MAEEKGLMERMYDMEVIQKFFDPAILRSSIVAQTIWKALRPLLAIPAGMTHNELDDKIIDFLDNIIDINS